MVKRIMAVLIVVLAVGALGCSNTKAPILAPDKTQESSDVHFRRYETIYTKCGTFYLDYPSDFTGPIPEGHGRIGATSTDLCARQFVPPSGDPTADE